MSRNKTWPIQRHQIHEFCLVALRHYGNASQIDKAIEECDELSEALQHYQASKGLVVRATCRRHVISEIADVLIMAHQMRLVFGEGNVDEMIAEKIKRQRQRMQEGE